MNGETESADPGIAAQVPSGTSPADPREVTQLLADWSRGDCAALGKLTPLVYEELRRLAHRYMQGQRLDHTLQTTALEDSRILLLSLS